MRHSFGLWISALLMLCACVRNSPEGESSDGAAPVPPPTPPSPSAESGAPASDEHVKIAPDVARACVNICQRSQDLACPKAAECQPHCIGMGSLTPCSKEIMALYRCLVDQPVKNWECGSDGVAAIRPGFCDPEQAEVVQCMERKMRR
jgi:hypothetical protein